MVINNLGSTLFLGLLLCINIYAEEASEKDENISEIVQNNNQEITDRIFDVWYEGRVDNNCDIFNGNIVLAKAEGQVYLNTVLNEESTEGFSTEVILCVLISRAIEQATKENKVKNGWIFLDKKTRCARYQLSDGHQLLTFRKCLSHFTEVEFEERLRQKEEKKQTIIKDDNSLCIEEV